MTANRTVRTGLTASAVISVRRLAHRACRDASNSPSPGSGPQPYSARPSPAMTMALLGPSGSPRAAVP